MRVVTTIGCLLGMVLSGCLPMDEFHRPPLALPATWGTTHTTDQPQEGLCPTDSWWTGFDSLTLNELEQTALQHNHDLKAAVARLSQADAQLRMARSPLLPALNWSASDQIAQRSANSGSGSSSRNATVRTSQTALSASYEIDFWGKNQAATRAAEAGVVASRFDQQVVTWTLTADLASGYFKLLALEARRRVAGQNQAINRQIQQLVNRQAELGHLAAQEVWQQQNTIALLDAQIATLEMERAQTLHGLALLTGQAAETLELSLDELTDLTIPTIRPGLPADLLRQRPDIQRAEANLMAAHADLAVARAAWFPAIQLTGEYGHASSALSTLLSPESRLWNLGASLAATLFDHGKTQGAIDLAEAKRTASMEAYQQAVIAALRDVWDALSAVQWLATQEQAQQTAAMAAKESFRLAEIRFRAGAVDYQTLLESQRTLLKADDDLLQTRQSRLTAAIGLFKALGGGMSEPNTPTQ